MPGGMPGRDGRDGATPVGGLCDGAPGPQGSFALKVVPAQGGVEGEFTGRYHLEAVSFVNCEFGHAVGDGSGSTTNNLAPDGVFEFGQICFVDGMKVGNVGRMPSPSMQRQLIKLVPGKWVLPQNDSVFTLRGLSLQPENCLDVVGQLRYQLGMIDIEKAAKDATDFEPVLVKEQLKLSCAQLGIELPDKHSEQTTYQREFEGFTPAEVCATDGQLNIQWPVQNRSGFLGLTSLAPGEATALQFLGAGR